MTSIDAVADHAVARALQRVRHARAHPQLGVLEPIVDLLTGDTPVLSTTVLGSHAEAVALLAAAFGADTAVITVDTFVGLDGRVQDMRADLPGVPKELSDVLLVTVVRGEQVAHRRLLYNRDWGSSQVEADAGDIEVVDEERSAVRHPEVAPLLAALRRPGRVRLDLEGVARTYLPLAVDAQVALLHHGGHPQYRQLQKLVLGRGAGLAARQGTLFNCAEEASVAVAELLQFDLTPA